MMEVWCEVCNRLMVERGVLLGEESYDVHVCINCEIRVRVKFDRKKLQVGTWEDNHQCLNTMMEGMYECDVCYPEGCPSFKL